MWAVCGYVGGCVIQDRAYPKKINQVEILRIKNSKLSNFVLFILFWPVLLHCTVGLAIIYLN